MAQALTDIGRVSPETRAQVLQAAKELGYRPNPLAQALVTGKTNTLAFWFYPTLEPTTVILINNLQMMVPPYGLLLMNLGLYKPGWGGEIENFPPGEWPVDGIFAFACGNLPPRIMERKAGNPPVIFIDYGAIPDEFNKDEVDAVVVKSRVGCEDAVRHLVQTRKRVAMLCVDVIPDSPLDGRTAAYESVMREAGQKPEYIRVPLRLPYDENAKHTLMEYVGQHGCPDGIFCASDSQTPAVHLALSELGYRVPEDVALIGFDGLPETEYHVPPLSTVVQPFEQICQTAWQFMQNRLANPETPLQYAELEMQFVARQSSAPPAIKTAAKPQKSCAR